MLCGLEIRDTAGWENLRYDNSPPR